MAAVSKFLFFFVSITILASLHAYPSILSFQSNRETQPIKFGRTSEGTLGTGTVEPTRSQSHPPSIGTRVGYRSPSSDQNMRINNLLICIGAMSTLPPPEHVSRHGTSIIKMLPPIYGPLKNANDASFEHVVPRSIISHSTKNRTALHDIHNIYSASLGLNLQRSNMPFTQQRPRHLSPARDGKGRLVHPFLFGGSKSVGHGNFVLEYPRARDFMTEKVLPDQVVHPMQFSVNPRYRGIVARCVLYMHDKWGCDPNQVICGGREVAELWHRRNPVTAMEMLHNYIGFQLQNDVNPYVCNITDAVGLIDLYHRRVQIEKGRDLSSRAWRTLGNA